MSDWLEREQRQRMMVYRGLLPEPGNEVAGELLRHALEADKRIAERDEMMQSMAFDLCEAIGAVADLMAGSGDDAITLMIQETLAKYETLKAPS